MAQPVIDMLNLRFGCLTYDGKPMNVGKKATTDSIAAMMEQLNVFSDDYNFGKPDRGLCSSYRCSRSSPPNTRR
jgi:hypothetical protein